MAGFIICSVALDFKQTNKKINPFNFQICILDKGGDVIKGEGRESPLQKVGNHGYRHFSPFAENCLFSDS